MVSTRSRGLALPERSLLQLERDQIASRMDFDWFPLSEEQTGETRGIVNCGNLCYQNSVLQTLMHQPGFIRWVDKHNTPSNRCHSKQCIKCAVVLLVRNYWGVSDPDIAVESSEGPGQIARLAVQSGMFDEEEQDDSMSFFTWLTNSLYEDPPNQQWQREFETLYRLEIQSYDRCTVCGHVRTMPMEVSTSLNIGVQSDYQSITNSITAAFQNVVENIHCSECLQNQTKYRKYDIIAAPKILQVQIAILQYDGKIMHSMDYPETLDLTAFQQFTTLPLEYRLSGVVSHAGEGLSGGHYIASVRGQNPNDFTCISDVDREEFQLAHFLASPQRPECDDMYCEDGYQVYMLSYIRDDTNRKMPPKPGNRGGRGRLQKELKSLISTEPFTRTCDHV
ncbi:hypothetical protein BKA66DRAFT_567732 [Pyrenochaeta sp. MPI-SDFR-AT-0127]|nr:hypothetical protein BKA66DRAFT_567732 [Pyrenochaeta sp. MPI-SDFR-AT-0127]